MPPFPAPETTDSGPMTTPPVFRTIIDVPANPRRIDHDKAALVVGSCFGEHMGSCLDSFHFPVCVNPTGVLYNPLSIAGAVERILAGREYTANEVFFDRGQWKSFEHHSRFNAATAEECLDKVNRSMRRAFDALERLGSVMLTFGTAFVYRRVSDGRVVTNCHRLPPSRFTRALAGIEEIVAACRGLLDTLYERFPELNVIMTVSPVRHLRDNPHENQVSKAHLMAAVYELERLYPGVYYFPSYEIMMDELRDYRFYDAGMTHPAPVAIDYLWRRFVEACVAPRSTRFIEAYTPVLTARSHRIENPASGETRAFAQGQLACVARLEEEYPEVRLEADRAHFESLVPSGSGEGPEGETR